MYELRASPHSLLEGQVFEVWTDNEMVATFYPTTDGIKITSKHFTDPRNAVLFDIGRPPAILIDIKLCQKRKSTKA